MVKYGKTIVNGCIHRGLELGKSYGDVPLPRERFPDGNYYPGVVGDYGFWDERDEPPSTQGDPLRLNEHN